MVNKELDLKIKELAESLKISVAQARELHQFPFKILKEDYLKFDVTVDQSTKLNFLYNNCFTIKVDSRKKNRWLEKISKNVI